MIFRRCWTALPLLGSLPRSELLHLIMLMSGQRRNHLAELGRKRRLELCFEGGLAPLKLDTICLLQLH
eukprot:8519519-Pyramimonas_sp.AAC.1